MRKMLALALAALGPLCVAQVAVTPIVQPHQTFADNSGAACALCKLYSYSAGTTTPLATYTDSGGVTQNTNPITLDIAGGANIWVASASAYKFVLKDSLGATIWTVDNVKSNGGGSLPCSTAYAINYTNSALDALTCDPTILINPSSHAIEVGGHISGPAFALRNLATIPDSWTMDVTTPNTALLSLGPVPLTDIATQAADSVVMNATGVSAAPTAVVMPTGCTTGVNYSTSTHAWTCNSASVPLSNLASQGPDTVVMNATAGSVPPTAVSMPTGCTTGVNYSTATHTWTCNTASNGVDYYFSFSGCTLSVGGNSANCQGSQNFSSVTPVVPTQADSNYYLSCNTLTGVAWGSSTGINSQSATGFQFAENVDRYNGIPATVTPTVWCHLHHN
jgi:hypothetical protein